jgi:hypothetical protein
VSQVATPPPAVAVPVSREGQLATHAAGDGHDSEDGHDRAALEMVATPLGSDRVNGDQDYARAAKVDPGEPRLRIERRVGADSQAPPAPSGNGAATIPAPPWRCYACMADKRELTAEGDWRCAGCLSRGVPSLEDRP